MPMLVAAMDTTQMPTLVVAGRRCAETAGGFRWHIRASLLVKRLFTLSLSRNADIDPAHLCRTSSINGEAFPGSSILPGFEVVMWNCYVPTAHEPLQMIVTLILICVFPASAR